MDDDAPAHVNARITELGNIIDAVHHANFACGVRHAVLFVARTHQAFDRMRAFAARSLPEHGWGERDDGIAMSVPQALADRFATVAGITPADTTPADRLTVVVMEHGTYATVLRLWPVGGGAA